MISYWARPHDDTSFIGVDDVHLTRREAFREIWNTTIKPKGRALYGWEAKPWVWVIEFEKISKEEAENG